MSTEHLTGLSNLFMPFAAFGPSSLPYDLIAAIVNALGGSSPTSLLPGGAHEGFAGQYAGAGTSRPMPYASVFDVTESPQYNSGLGYWSDGTIQINVFNTTRLLARQTADIIAALLNDNPLTFQVALLTNLRQSGRYTQKDPDPGPGNTPVYMEARMFSYSLSGSIA